MFQPERHREFLSTKSPCDVVSASYRQRRYHVSGSILHYIETIVKRLAHMHCTRLAASNASLREVRSNSDANFTSSSHVLHQMRPAAPLRLARCTTVRQVARYLHEGLTEFSGSQPPCQFADAGSAHISTATKSDMAATGSGSANLGVCPIGMNWAQTYAMDFSSSTSTSSMRR